MSDAIPYIQRITGTESINEWGVNALGVRGVSDWTGKVTGAGAPGVRPEERPGGANVPKSPVTPAEVPKPASVSREGGRRRSLLSEEEGGLLSQAPTYRRSLLGY